MSDYNAHRNNDNNPTKYKLTIPVDACCCILTCLVKNAFTNRVHIVLWTEHMRSTPPFSLQSSWPSYSRCAQSLPQQQQHAFASCSTPVQNPTHISSSNNNGANIYAPSERRALDMRNSLIRNFYALNATATNLPSRSSRGSSIKSACNKRNGTREGRRGGGMEMEIVYTILLSDGMGRPLCSSRALESSIFATLVSFGCARAARWRRCGSMAMADGRRGWVKNRWPTHRARPARIINIDVELYPCPPRLLWRQCLSL